MTLSSWPTWPLTPSSLRGNAFFLAGDVFVLVGNAFVFDTFVLAWDAYVLAGDVFDLATANALFSADTVDVAPLDNGLAFVLPVNFVLLVDFVLLVK